MVSHMYLLKMVIMLILIDISEAALEKALLTIANNLDRMVKKEKITNDKKRKDTQSLK